MSPVYIYFYLIIVFIVINVDFSVLYFNLLSYSHLIHRINIKFTDTISIKYKFF